VFDRHDIVNKADLSEAVRCALGQSALCIVDS
jgi:hypothetical protein